MYDVFQSTFTKYVCRVLALNVQDKCSEKPCNGYGVCLNTFILGKNLYLKEGSIQNFRFQNYFIPFQKLQAISFFAYEHIVIL